MISASKSVAYAVLISTEAEVSKTVTYASLILDNSYIYVPLIATEPVSGGQPSILTNLLATEPLTGGNSVVRVCLIVVEALIQVDQEVIVVDDILPTGSAIKAPLSASGLRGLGWSTMKNPTFRTQVNSAVSGKETRNSRMQYPIYEFDLTYEFLDERDGKTELSTLMGFFMSQRGMFGEWLYQDPSDYISEGVEIGIGDGGTVAFFAMKQIGTFVEPIGYFDLTDLFLFDNTDVNTTDNQVTVPGHNLETGFGPVRIDVSGTIPAGLDATVNYWLIKVDDDTLQFATSKANAIAGTEVDITTTGSGTFTVRNGVAVYIDGTQVATADYQVILNNEIEFDTAPSAAEVLTIDCKFFYICRFTQDVQDFEQFMYNLWTLESLSFVSVIK